MERARVWFRSPLALTSEMRFEDRKRAEAELTVSQRSLAAIFGQTIVGLAQTDLAGRFLVVNDKYCEIAGRSREELLFLRVQDITHPDDLAANSLQFEECARTGTPFEFETRYLRADGSFIWVHGGVSATCDAAGTPGSLVAAAHDITERKQVEEAVREREAWLAGQQEALEAALNGAPLETSLGALVRTAVERFGQNVRAAFYLANREGTALRHLVGMAPAYAAAVAGFPIGPESLSCGLATHTGLPVLTSDVTKEPLWAPWLWLAEKFDFRGCWSFPIHTEARRFVGTLAVYWPQPREATQRDRELAEVLTQAAGIIIARHTEAEARRETEEALRESEAQLKSELADSKLLQDISAEMMREGKVDALYDKIMNAAVVIMRSDYASMQMLYRERGAGGELRLLAFRGFNPEAAKFWEWVRADSQSTCGMALRTGKRVIASDVETCSFMAGTDDLATYLQTGIRAVQTTPLFSRSGVLVGMISTHWSKSHEPVERDLRLLDILARQAADLIERRQAEEELRESVERLRFMAESMPQKVFTARPDGEVDYFNRQWIEFTGLSFEELRDRGWRQVVHPEDLDENVRLWKHSIETRQPFQFVHRLRRADGGYRWHLSRAHAMQTPDGRTSMWIGSDTDIHEQKKTEQELRRLNEDLNQFAYAASHDLREPLRNIGNYTELLLRTYGDRQDGYAERFRKYIVDGVARLEILLDDLLAYTQIGNGGPPTAVDCNAVLQKALQNLSTTIEGSGALITSETLPVLVGQEAHYVQLFQNLIGNAIKYKGQEPPRVHVGVESTHNGWRFSVKDNGIGIEREYADQIFGLFKRLHRNDIPGTGIGLAICAKVVERHGGRIWVESEPGHGAEFCFIVPSTEVGAEVPLGRQETSGAIGAAEGEI